MNTDFAPIDIKGLRADNGSGGYAYANIIERRIAHIFPSVFGIDVSDFGEDGVPRFGYDFRVGGMPVELKMTEKEKIPVEISRDEEGLIPSGLALSTAPIVMTVSNGHGSREFNSKPAAKIRWFFRPLLLAKAAEVPYTFWKKGEFSTENARVHYLGPYFDYDIFLGDMDYVRDSNGENRLIDERTFAPHHKAQQRIERIIKRYHNGDFN